MKSKLIIHIHNRLDDSYVEVESVSEAYEAILELDEKQVIQSCWVVASEYHITENLNNYIYQLRG